MDQNITDSETDTEELLLKVALKLGWKELGYSSYRMLIGHVPGKRITRPVPHFTSNLHDAWIAISQCLSPLGMDISLTHRNIGGGTYTTVVEIRATGHAPWRALHRTPAVALCLAFQAIPDDIIDGFVGVRPRLMGRSVPK